MRGGTAGKEESVKVVYRVEEIVKMWRCDKDGGRKRMVPGERARMEKRRREGERLKVEKRCMRG
jgi:hypothetical protein